MKLIAKNNTVGQLLESGVTKEEINKITTIYDNVFELSSEERIIPNESDEHLYILHNDYALYKNEVYRLFRDITDFKITKIDNDYKVEYTNNEEGQTEISECKLSQCKVTDFGLLIAHK